jgi:pilus assembly protein CpaB
VDTTSKLLFGAGAVLALLVGVAVYVAMSAAQGFGRGTVPAVVARQDVPELTLFTGANVNELLATRQLPPDAVPRGALGQPSEAIGRVATRPLAAGEVVLGTPERLASGEGGAGARPAATIPRDRVALAIAATDAVSVAGAIHAGDRVDVIATWSRAEGDPVTQDIIQDVRVFAVGRWQGDGRGPQPATAGAATGGPPSTTITLLLDYQQAVMVEHLVQTGGKVTLALRRFDQSEDVVTEPVTTDSLSRRYLGRDGAVGTR